jgi:hypothetical protein
MKRIPLRINAKKRSDSTAGLLLCHNDVPHETDTPNGPAGFRAWFTEAREVPHFVECPCGWRLDLGMHFAPCAYVKTNPKCTAACT